MICIVSLIIFSILGIFSATHRALAREALTCVFRRITLRPCDTGFKEKIKGRVTVRLLTHSPALARFFNRHSELLSWIFIILMIWSTVFVIRGGYNYYLYGSCNGLNATGFCLFDPTGENNKISPIANKSCPTHPVSEKNLSLKGVDLNSFPHIDNQSKDNLIMIGCYSCDYTHKTYPLIEQLRKKYNVNYTFMHFPVKPDTFYLSAYDYCAFSLDPNKFWDLNEQMFASSAEQLDKPEFVNDLAVKAGYQINEFLACVQDPSTAEITKKQYDSIAATGIYGTPTIFINEKVFVGPKPYRVYSRALSHFWDFLKF